MRKKHKGKVLLLTVGVILISMFFYNFNIREIVYVVRSVPKYAILLTLFLHLLTLILGSLKWRIMLRNINYHNDMGLIFKIHISSIYFDNITPGAKIGGEGVRLYFMRNILGTDYASAMGLLSLDKVITLLPFIAMCVPAVIWQWHILNKNFVAKWALIVIIVLAIIVTAIIVAMLRFGGKSEEASKTQLSKFKLFFSNAGYSFRFVFAKRGEMLPLILLSTILWLCYPLKMHVLALAIGIDISFKVLSSASILAYLVGMLPLAPGGLGFYDGTIGGILLSLGISSPKIGSLVLLYRLTTYLFSLALGGIATIDLFNRVVSSKKVANKGGYIDGK